MTEQTGTTPEKRARAVAIAKDVLEQMSLGAYRPEVCVYVNRSFGGAAGTDLQSLLPQIVNPEKPCEVCAIGSAFLSAVRLYDKFAVPAPHTLSWLSSQIQGSTMRTVLGDYFEEEDLYALETCFEVNVVGLIEQSAPIFAHEWNSTTHEVLREFLRKLPVADRLRWIMNVVIRNGGRFNLGTARYYALRTYQAALSFALRPAPAFKLFGSVE